MDIIEAYEYIEKNKEYLFPNDKYSEETDGGWLVSLQEAKVPKSALFLFKTDYETTAAAVATLTKDAV